MSYDEYGDYNGYAPAAAEHYVRTIHIYFRTLYADHDFMLLANIWTESILNSN